MTKPRLTDADFCRAAQTLGCSVAAIQAVAEVESLGAGFYDDGFPVILFERHKFSAFTKGRYDKTHRHLSGPAGGYGKAGQNQRNKFNEAFALDPQAAMKSCSWGKFQIMGFNHEAVGFPTVDAFVDAMKESEGRQLDAFVAFIKANKLQRHLVNLDWTAFARGYNGPGYAKNKYDTKMAAAFTRFSKRAVDCSKVSAAAPAEASSTPTKKKEHSAPTASDTPQPINDSSQTADTIVNVGDDSPQQQDVTETAKVAAPEPYNGIGFWATIRRDLAAATGGNLTFASLAEYATQASGWPEWLTSILSRVAIGVFIATIVYFAFRFIHFLVDTWKKNQKTKLEADINTDVNRKNIEWL